MPPGFEHGLEGAAVEIRTQPILEQTNDARSGNRGIDGKIACGAKTYDERTGRIHLHNLPVTFELALDERADVKPLQETLARLVERNPQIAPDVDVPLYSLCERTEAAATRTLANYPAQGVVNNGVNYPPAYWQGIVARWRGETDKAREAFSEARKQVEPLVDAQPDFAAAISLLGIIDAGLGRNREAVEEGERSCKLLPVSKDALDGMFLAINLAQIYAWTGHKDLAIEQIAAVERMPNMLSYGSLKLHPIWDSLHGDARFEKIVTSLAPR